MLIEALCVCDSPFCHHTAKTGEVQPCPNLATGKFYVLGYGEFCRECANNYGILYGKEQVVLLRRPENGIQAIGMPGMMVEGELERDYLIALSRQDPELDEEELDA